MARAALGWIIQKLAEQVVLVRGPINRIEEGLIDKATMPTEAYSRNPRGRRHRIHRRRQARAPACGSGQTHLNTYP